MFIFLKLDIEQENKKLKKDNIIKVSVHNLQYFSTFNCLNKKFRMNFTKD